MNFNTKKKQVLFISHDATRTGAPILLLNTLKWLGQNSDLSLKIMLKAGGPLQKEFEGLAECELLNPPPANKTIEEYSNILLKKLKDVSLIYSNTIANGSILPFFSQIGCPITTHMHELEYIIDLFGKDNISNAVKYSNHWIAASNPVKGLLLSTYHVPENKITVAQDFIGDEWIGQKKHKRGSVLTELSIPEDSIVIGGSGLVEPRKGPDLFVQVASILKKRRINKNIYFVWFGKYSKLYLDLLMMDVKKAGLGDLVHFPGQIDDPVRYYSAFDIFLMPSREEAFSLVSVENMALGNPVICFDRSGGPSEIVNAKNGFVVPYLDLQEMADKIVRLIEDPQLLSEMSKNASKTALEYQAKDKAPIILDAINKMISH